MSDRETDIRERTATESIVVESTVVDVDAAASVPTEVAPTTASPPLPRSPHLLVSVPNFGSCFSVFFLVPALVLLAGCIIYEAALFGFHTAHLYPREVFNGIRGLIGWILIMVFFGQIHVSAFWAYSNWRTAKALWEHSGGKSGITPLRALLVSLVANPSTICITLGLEVGVVQLLYSVLLQLHLRQHPVIAPVTLIFAMLATFAATNGGAIFTSWGGWYVLSRFSKYLRGATNQRVGRAALLVPPLLAVPCWWLAWNTTYFALFPLISLLCLIPAFALLCKLRVRTNEVLTGEEAPATTGLQYIRQIAIPLTAIGGVVLMLAVLGLANLSPTSVSDVMREADGSQDAARELDTTLRREQSRLERNMLRDSGKPPE
jgi:hypothetical protein